MVKELFENIGINILRKTYSFCPVCMKQVKAFLVEKNGAVYFEKTCLQHGDSSVLVSESAQDYRELNDFYFYFVPLGLPQKEYYFNLINRCNISCPMCFLDFNEDAREFTIERIKQLAKNNKIKRFTFSHGEPTINDNLCGIIKIFRHSGKITSIHTNGLKLADYNYALSLKLSGINHISLQFDGFDERVYEQLRGKRLLSAKLKALDNLRKLSIPVTLNVTVAKGINENEIGRIFDYSIREHFIKDISFITYSNYDTDQSGMSKYIMPDELLKHMEAYSGGKISRRNILLFQKLFYAYISVFKKRKCFYYYHFLVVRMHKGYATVDELIDLPKACRKLDAIKLKNRKLTHFSFFLILLSALKIKALFLLPFDIPMFFRGGFPDNPSRFMVITFATICDPYKYDVQIAANCGQGIFMSDGEYESYGSFLLREMQKKKK